MSNGNSPKWQQAIWAGAGLSLFATIILLLSLVGWTVAKVIGIIASQHEPDLGFVLTSIGVVTLTLLRFLAVLIGAAIAFAGLAVSFFAHSQATTFEIDSATQNTLPKATLATYSPGIVGIVVGAVVIVCALYARSNHNYEGPSSVVVLKPTTESVGENPSAKMRDLNFRPLEEVLGRKNEKN